MRDMIVEVDDPLVGKVKLPATPMRFSATTVVKPEPPPLLGEHNEAVLKAMLGLTDADIEQRAAAAQSYRTRTGGYPMP